MLRLAVAALLAAGCAAESPDTSQIDQSVTLAFTREHITADIYHYSATIPVGSQPNAAIRIHRVVREIAPFVPRPAAHAVMLLHGDFASFVTNFAPTLGDPPSTAPGLAPYLAAHDIDVWGIDRRWTLATDDTSDFAGMTVAQEVDDLTAALALARAQRGGGRLALVGFSHGAELAYIYAAVEAARPAVARAVSALVPLDYYGDYAPEQADLRAATCANADAEYDLVAGGTVDSPNDFQITVGQLAASAPDDPSPFDADFGLDVTNRELMLLFAGQTYELVPISPVYHLLSPTLDDGIATGLRETPEPIANAWFAGAPLHESMVEAGDFDAQLCGDGTTPVDAPLSRITVPLLYIGAGGAVGSLGVHATTQVSSRDVTTLVISVTDDPFSDYGHGDLLYATNAPARVWAPLASWLATH